MQKLGYPLHLQNLICSGRSLQDDHNLHAYNILPSTTIILNLRLRGGGAGSSKSKGLGGVVGCSLPKGTVPNQKSINVDLSYKNIISPREINNYNKLKPDT